MNKKKSLLLAILSFIAVFALAFSFGCSGCNNNNEENNGGADDKVLSGKYEGDEDVVEDPADDWVLQSIALDVTDLKTTYNYGEDFETGKKPVVKATFATLESVIKNEEGKLQETTSNRLVTEERTVSADDVKVDFGQYDKNAVGTYNIYVSYSHAGVTRAAKYTVEVRGTSPDVGGITVELDENHANYSEGSLVYYISSVDGVTVDLTGAYSVYAVDEELNQGEEAITEGITLSYYKEGTQIENLNGLQKGTYTVYVKYNNSSTFFVVEVLDPVASIALKPETGIFTQVQSPVEEMTSTWEFVVTYQSGLTREIKKGDAGLLVGNVITVLPAEDSVTVVYTEGNEKVSVSVTYTITENTELANEKEEFNRDALGLTSGDTKLTQDHLTGDNSFLKKGDNSNVVLTYRAGTDNGCLEIRYDALNIEFYGFGTLMVSARSTSAGNKSAIALKNAEGKYISAIYDVTDVNIKEGTTKDGNVYMVSGDMQKQPAPDGTGTVNVPYMARILTFIVPEAGVYTLCTVDAVDVEGETASIATNRNTRVYKIEKTDVFDNTIDRVSYEFDINTDNVKIDYIAGETVLSKEGLTATFTEVHSVEEDIVTRLTADDLKVVLTSGDLAKLNTKGTVTVTYSVDGKDYTKTYTINIKSPVTGVNAVALTKETTSYEQATENGTVTISKEDIVLHKNDSTGDIITLGEGESVEYKLFNGQEELTSWEVADGTYTIKAIIVLNNTESVVPGTTEFEASINVTVKKWVDPSADKVAYEVTYTVVSDGAETPTYSWTNAWKDDKQGAATDVSVDTSNVTSLKPKEKSLADDTTVKYSNYGEVKAPKDDGTGGAKYIAVTIGAKAQNASIKVYASHTSGSYARAIVISSAIDTPANVVSETNKKASAVIGGEGNLTTNSIHTITASNLTAGTYYITSDANANGVHVYAIVVSYEVAAEPSKPAKIELDASTLTVQEAIVADSTVAWGECAEIIGYGDADGKKVAIVADSATLVGDKAGTTVSNRIKLGGGIQSKGAQGIKLTLDKACTIKAYIKNSGTGTGRIPNLFDGSKKAVTNSTVELDTTGSIHEITLNVTDEMITANSGVLYLGVNTGGCLVYYVTIDYGA